MRRLRSRLDAVLAELVPARLEQALCGALRRVPAAPSLAGSAGRRPWRPSRSVVSWAPAWCGAPNAPPVLQAAAQANGQGWVQRAAVAHSVYDAGSAPLGRGEGAGGTPARWLTKRLEIPVKLFGLRAQGFELVGGRLLPDAKGPSAQLMYQAMGEPPAGQQPLRVTVYLRKPEDGTPAAFRYEQQGATGLFYWVEARATASRPAATPSSANCPASAALAQAIDRQGDDETRRPNRPPERAPG